MIGFLKRKQNESDQNHNQGREHQAVPERPAYPVMLTSPEILADDRADRAR